MAFAQSAFGRANSPAAQALGPYAARDARGIATRKELPAFWRGLARLSGFSAALGCANASSARADLNMITVRGAITARSNTREDILLAAREMTEEMLRLNSVGTADVRMILYTATKDLDAAYPAEAARMMGITEASLMCAQEMHVAGSLQMALRATLLADSPKLQSEAEHAYLGGAAKLRPDLAKRFAIAIDGPSGVGKSTLAKDLAKELGIAYVDTGAMYRAAGIFLRRQGVDLLDKEQVSKAIQNIAISIKRVGGDQRVLLGDDDVTDLLRSPEAADGASKSAAVSAVREKLVKLQQKIGREADAVMDGRDICAKVLPWAQVKIYLDASPEARARRRMAELAEKGLESDFDSVKRDILERDLRDKTREDSPLEICPEASYIDTSCMGREEVKEIALGLIRHVSQK
ncbi:MAG: (d)CMP kinase [Clostridiales bacterium]|nr:(d)CMP kinase [Clostridiales bacterium]